jgi:RND family efflux transporter MFP subunit
VPERFSPLLAEGQTIEATAIARPDKSHQGRIVAIDNRIDAASRTMRVQAEIGNEDDSLRAGQGFEVALALPGDHYPSVSPLAIQWDSQGAYVWRLKDQKVERVAVKIMARNPDSVLVSGELEKGQEVVVEGLQRLRNGIEVKLFGSEPTKTEADKTASVPGKTKGAAAAPGAAQ